jgi:hypothetical protein
VASARGAVRPRNWDAGSASSRDAVAHRRVLQRGAVEDRDGGWGRGMRPIMRQCCAGELLDDWGVVVRHEAATLRGLPWSELALHGL